MNKSQSSREGTRNPMDFETPPRTGEQRRGDSGESWLAGQNQAFRALLEGLPVGEALAILVPAAVACLGEDGCCALSTADGAGLELRCVAGVPGSFREDFPIEVSGEIAGTFAIYFKSPREATPRECELASDLTRIAALLISHSREAERRSRAEQELRRSEARQRALAAELQEADRRKNHFLAMLGHELRNPLAAIRSGVLLLRSEKARPESRAVALPIVSQQVAHMERLVDDMLDLTRITQNKVQVRRETMVVQLVLRQALETLRSQMETGGFIIDVREPAAPLEILGDRVRLTQVFLNVLSNAVKFSGRSRRIEVSAAREADTAVVRFRDHGVGIPPDLLPQIFEPFVQAATEPTMRSGLGLGLAIVRELVRLHDGEVEAFSAGPGKGTELVVRLPLVNTA